MDNYFEKLSFGSLQFMEIMTQDGRVVFGGTDRLYFFCK